MQLRKSVITGLLGGLLLSGACTAAPESEQAKDVTPKASDNEMIEITIRMPDGRVIVRKEPKSPSRIDPNHPITKGERPSVSGNPKVVVAKDLPPGTINVLGSDVTGGSNAGAGSMKTAGGGGGGGGGSSSSGRSGGGGGGGGSSADTDRTNDSDGSDDSSSSQVPSYPPDNDYTVRMLAWDNSGAQFENVIRAYVADPQGKTPQQLAQRIAMEIAEDQPEKIAIRFWKEFEPATRDPFDYGNPRDLIQTGGYTQGLREYWDAFAYELSQLNVQPDFLIHDMERGIGFWNIPVEDRRNFFEEVMDPNRTLNASLPDSMREVTVDQFMNYRNPQGTRALNDYNRFASEFRATILRDVFSQAFQAAYGEYIPISNYRDIDPTFQVLHFTNRPEPVATTGGISAPIAYLDLRTENTPRYARTQKDQRWNRLIDVLNRVRSSSATGLVTPWVSSPGYGRYGADTWARQNDLEGEYRFWNIMMDHMLAMGIDTFILWNPGTRFNPHARTTDAYIDQWLAEHPQGAGPQLTDLSEIELDADFIITNGVVTSYEDYLDALNNR